jgi:hypothetical protein
MLPFYPAGWSWGLAGLAALAAALRPRLGLAAALAAAVLPLGNVSLGLALVYAGVSGGWLLATWRRSHEGFYPVAGAVLAPLGLMLVVPALLLAVRSAAWRAIHGAAAVLVAAVAAAVHGATLPLSDREPSPLAIAGREDAGGVAATLADFLTARPEIVVTALVVAALAALLRPAAERGVWPVAALGGAATAALLLPVAAVNALPAVVGIWLCCVAATVRVDALRR